VARREAQVSVVKKGLPVPGGENDDPALFEVAEGPAADEGLGDGPDVDGGHDAAVDTHA
jgi:hypothetical protein